MLHATAGSGRTDPDLVGLKWRVYLRVFFSALSGILFALAWIRWDPTASLQDSLAAGLLSAQKKDVLYAQTQPPYGRLSPSGETSPALRDPFSPMTLDSGRKPGRRRRRLLKGIFQEGERKFALIGSRMVTQGDWIFGMRVITIRNNKVVLANNQKIRVLFLF